MNYSAKMLRDNALVGKTIVVTGGGSGLGKAMTRYFLELGAKVAITSRDLAKLENTAAELAAETVRFTVVVVAAVTWTTLGVTLTPLGSPDIPTVTVPAKPRMLLTVTGTVVLSPGAKEMTNGLS